MTKLDIRVLYIALVLGTLGLSCAFVVAVLRAVQGDWWYWLLCPIILGLAAFLYTPVKLALGIAGTVK
jgi:hypothetical protein